MRVYLLLRYPLWPLPIVLTVWKAHSLAMRKILEGLQSADDAKMYFSAYKILLALENVDELISSTWSTAHYSISKPPPEEPPKTFGLVRF